MHEKSEIHAISAFSISFQKIKLMYFELFWLARNETHTFFKLAKNEIHIFLHFWLQKMKFHFLSFFGFQKIEFMILRCFSRKK